MKWVTPLMASGATQTASEGTCMLQAHSAEACMTIVVEMFHPFIILMSQCINGNAAHR